MIKSLGILIGGIFVGAIGMEIFHRKYPKALNEVYTKTCQVASEAKEAFKTGYRNAVRPQTAVEAGA
ncbi:MAG: hypothetical protein ACYS1A_09830 [Planctomycetota bacterium]|jgi:hypothetical protein